MGHIICSCGWKKLVKSCVEAEKEIKEMSHKCPNCLFWNRFKYIHE